MIFSDLKNILDERHISIATLSEKTGLNRATVTALYQGSSNGVKFDTIDKICNVLGILPSDLMLFIPISRIVVDKQNATITFFKHQSLPIANGDSIQELYHDGFTFKYEITKSNKAYAKIKLGIAKESIIKYQEFLDGLALNDRQTIKFMSLICECLNITEIVELSSSLRPWTKWDAYRYLSDSTK